jgi:hypothetical protein
MSRCRRLAVAAIALSLLSARPGRAGVNVSIGIDLSGPPELVSVPGTPVLWAPPPGGQHARRQEG